MVLLSLVLHACITFSLLSNKELDTFYEEYCVSYPLIINASIKNNHRILWGTLEKDFTHFYVCESMDMDMVLKMSVDLSYTI